MASMFTSAMLDTLEAFALTHLGVAWVDECWDLHRGADCWTWVWHCYNAAGIVLPRNLWAAKTLFGAIACPGSPGDVLYFEPPGAPRPHLGVALRQRRFVDCNWSGAGVAINDVSHAPWRNALVHVWRYRGSI